MDSLGWSWDDRWWRCHGAAAPAEGARGAGGAPAREERRGPAGEDQWEVENRFRGLPRVEDGGRRGLHGELERRVAMAGRRHHSGTGTARLGLVREGEWRGRVETPLGEANGEGESSTGGGVVVEQLGTCGVAVACSPSGSNGRVRGAAAATGRGELRAHHGRP